MSMKNCIKLVSNNNYSSGYHFKSSSTDDSFVLSSKHGACGKKNNCDLLAKNPNSCKTCTLDIELHELTITKSDGSNLTPIDLYISNNKDIVLMKVSEQTSIPLRVGLIDNDTFTMYGFKGEDEEASRIILDTPERQASICRFNIKSNSTPELIEKSEYYDGLSGSIVLTYINKSIPVAHAVITDNLTANDLGGETLFDMDHDELDQHFNCKVFHATRKLNPPSNNLHEEFSCHHQVDVSQGIKISLLIPKEIGHPYFSLKKIAGALLDNFGNILGTKFNSPEKAILSASKIVSQHSNLSPVEKLLCGRISESLHKAPHIYSTSISNKHYHHMHLHEDESGKFSLMASIYCEKDNLPDAVNAAIDDAFRNINKYQLNEETLLERSYLAKNTDHNESEDIFELFFGGAPIRTSSLFILFTVPLATPDKNNYEAFISNMKKLIDDASSKISKLNIEKTNQGYTLNIFALAIPVNEKDELYLAFMDELDD